MHLNDALSRIAEIHGHLDKSEIYRGYRALPVALSGVMALIGAALQPFWIGAEDGEAYVWFWMNIALINSVLCGGDIVRRYLTDTPHGRRQARRTLGQFVPCLGAGALVTASIMHLAVELVVILPGLWAILFSLGIFSSRPFLPKAAGWIACFYLVTGAGLLVLAEGGASLSPWGMGMTFGIGQIAAAFMLYWNIERKNYV